MWKRNIKSFRYAFNGLYDLFSNQPNALIHLFVMGVVVVAGFFFSISMLEWCAVSLAIAIVLAAEAFNTALEYLTDLVSPGFHPLAGRTKDVAAAGVLIAAFGASAVGMIVFLPKILALFNA